MMKQGQIIMLQEVHGTVVELQTFIDSNPYPYLVFFSRLPEGQGGGGIATMVPNFDKQAWESIHTSHIGYTRNEVMAKEDGHIWWASSSVLPRS